MKRLDISPLQLMNIRFPGRADTSSAMVVYFVHQSSERFLRNRIGEHHDQPFSDSVPAKLQLQLEKNLDFFQWGDSRETPRSSRGRSLSSAPIPDRPAPWYDDARRTASQASSEVDPDESSSTGRMEHTLPLHIILISIRRLCSSLGSAQWTFRSEGAASFVNRTTNLEQARWYRCKPPSPSRALDFHFQVSMAYRNSLPHA